MSKCHYPVQPTSLLSKIFGSIVLLMIIYFLISIVHSMAQTFAKRRDEQELKKTNWSKPIECNKYYGYSYVTFSLTCIFSAISNCHIVFDWSLVSTFIIPGRHSGTYTLNLDRKGVLWYSEVSLFGSWNTNMVFGTAENDPCVLISVWCQIRRGSTVPLHM